jgi:signal transduction histidine kinase
MGMKSPLPVVFQRNALRYFLPVLLTVAVLLACRYFGNHASDAIQYLLLSAVIAFCAWSLGLKPTAVSVALVLGAALWWPGQGFQVPLREQSLILAGFLVTSGAIMAMAEARRREHHRLEETRTDLESAVKTRTRELDAATRSLRDLSARLLQLQDEERRRIARELHDSVGQSLVGLSMNLSTVRSQIEGLTKAAFVLTDSENLIQQMTKEVRTISHLLHPPLLDEAGLSSAIRWYIDGFAERSQIRVEFDCPDDFPRLAREGETAMFRVVQESLTNIHKHSGSREAKITCRRLDRGVLLEVQDQGSGIAPDKLPLLSSNGVPGVGIRGMKERLRQLGGDLEINSSGQGTTVVARLPLSDHSQNSSDVGTSHAAA